MVKRPKVPHNCKSRCNYVQFVERVHERLIESQVLLEVAHVDKLLEHVEGYELLDESSVPLGAEQEPYGAPHVAVQSLHLLAWPVAWVANCIADRRGGEDARLSGEQQLAGHQVEAVRVDDLVRVGLVEGQLADQGAASCGCGTLFNEREGG